MFAGEVGDEATGDVAEDLNVDNELVNLAAQRLLGFSGDFVQRSTSTNLSVVASSFAGWRRNVAGRAAGAGGINGDLIFLARESEVSACSNIFLGAQSLRTLASRAAVLVDQVLREFTVFTDC